MVFFPKDCFATVERTGCVRGLVVATRTIGASRSECQSKMRRNGYPIRAIGHFSPRRRCSGRPLCTKHPGAGFPILTCSSGLGVNNQGPIGGWGLAGCGSGLTQCSQEWNNDSLVRCRQRIRLNLSWAGSAGGLLAVIGIAFASRRG